MPALATDLRDQGFGGAIAFDLSGLLAVDPGAAPASPVATARPSTSSSLAASHWAGRNFWWLFLVLVALCGVAALVASSIAKDAQEEREAIRRARIYEDARRQSMHEEAARIQALNEPTDAGVRADGVEVKGHSSSVRVLSRRVDAGAVRTAQVIVDAIDAAVVRAGNRNE